MSFVRPYAEVEPPENSHSAHELAFIAIGLMGLLSFNWDHGNMYKNADKHGVSIQEIETAFTNSHAFVDLIKQPDIRKERDAHYWSYIPEARYMLFSRQGENKYLKVVFTLRTINNQLCVRPISAHYVKEKDVRRKVARSRYNDHIW